MNKKPPNLAYFSLFISVLTLGFSAIFVRWANAPGLTSAFYRMGIATVIMAIPFYRKYKSIRPIPKKGVWLAIFGGIFFAADLGSWTTGVMLGGATNPTLLANTAPLWVGIGALLIFKEKLTSAFWLGLGLTFLGATVILRLDSLAGQDVALGSVFGIVAAFFYGGYFLFAQKGREYLDSLTYFWISAGTSTIILFLFVLLFRQPLSGYSQFTYFNFLGMGIIAQVIGYLSINYSLGHLPASLVSPTLLGQPVITALLAVPLLGEQISGPEIFGGIIVLTGIFTVHRSRQ